MSTTPACTSPLSITIVSATGNELPVTSLQDGRFDDLYRLQRSLAEADKPFYAAFGADEFVNEEGFRSLVDSGDTLIPIDGQKDDAIDSFVCVAPSVFARYYNAAVADIFVGVDSAQAKAGIFRKWIDIANAHARKLGYVTALVQTFVTNVGAYNDLRDADYEFCAVLPTSGRLRSVGVTDTILWRNYVAERNTCDFSVRRVPRDECWYFGPPRLIKDMGLPRRYTLKDGTVVEMNKLQSEDVEAYCRLFVEATERGEGYTADETDPELTRHLIQNGNVGTVTFKTVDTSEVIAAGLLFPATFSRTTDPLVCGGAMVVRPDFLSTGLGSLLMEVWPEVAISYGFDALSGETHAKHTVVLHMSIKIGMRLIGCIPCTIKLPIYGWGDTILIYMQFGRYVKASKIL